MTAIIWNKDGKPVRQSHNLRGIFEHARGRGVDSIDVYQLAESAHRPTGYVVVNYKHGDAGETYFVCGSHAAEWARDYSRKSPRVSWFAGCTVNVQVVPHGVWDYNETRPHLKIKQGDKL